MKCKFDIAWYGQCPTDTEKEFCEKHLGVKCFNCQAQATTECDSAGSLVCGMPRCEDHDHYFAH